MKRFVVRFNIYLLGLIALALAGCKTTEEKKREKEITTLRFHLETNPVGGNRDVGVAVYREEPMLIHIERDPFLNEGDIEKAGVVPALGGFAIKIQFNQHGTWVLENVTTTHKRKRIVIHSLFGESRWLAAPVITQRISNGVFVFTPDADHEEAERIVRGLNNLVARLEKKSRF